jgi:hypothetical protein
MSNAALPAPARPPRAAPLRLSIAGMQRGVLWLFIASGAFASLEPSPYEMFFILALLAFGMRGLSFDRSLIPLILGLVPYSVGGVLALTPFIQERESATFVAISVYMSATAVFFAALIANSPLERMRTIRSGYVAAGCVASLFAIVGYFDIGGLGEHFTLYGRASGTFKDPNVLGSFLVPPLVWLTQDIMLRRGGGLARSVAPLLVMLTALLLTFSRGSWGVWAASTTLMVGLTFLTTRSPALRRRIVVLSVVGLIGVLILLTIALSIPAVRDVYDIRASLSQDYDLGQLGRFGAQWRSLPMLLDLPFGFGPLQFRNHFYGEDPHDVYINAFASYGWIGGLFFAAFTTAMVYLGWRLVFQRTPFQTQAIAVWSCLFIQILQGFQIDTDHWRHLFLLMGALFGLVAGSRGYAARQQAGSAPINAGRGCKRRS